MFDNRAQLDKVSKAFLVAVHFRDVRESDIGLETSLLDELAELVDTMGMEVVRSLMVETREPQSKFLIGSGKAEEIVLFCKENQVDVIVFDNELSPSQQRNWERLAEGTISVIDREEVILEIFGRRAKTREARLQIGLAMLEYSLPRLTRAWLHLGRQSGGIGGKGEGETQLETDRRIVQKKIEKLKVELDDVRSQRSTQRKQRQRRPTPVAAIVGYTNAGKSSLLKKFTGADVLVEDKLFATLDTTTRKILLPNGQELLLTDTVGFVRKLPHRLVESFKATLEEAAEADYLIHVLDVANSRVDEFYQTTLAVLAELGADAKPTVTVFNKADLLEDPFAAAAVRARFPDALFVSTVTGEGLDELLHRVGDMMAADLVNIEVELPHTRHDLAASLHRIGQVISEEFSGESIHVYARLPKRFVARYEAYLKKLD